MEDTIFENEIAFVLIVKNESRYIGEWLEYHYRIGVDKFYIYDNDSEDRSELLKILEPWIQAGVVDFEDAPGQFRQMPVYNDAIERHRFDCRYMGFIDTDEFIYIKTGQTLPEFLNDYFPGREIISGFCINWRMFGMSGKKFYEPLDVIERFTIRNEDESTSNYLVKSIVNPRRILYMPNPHAAQYMIYSEACDEALRYVRSPQNQYNTCEKIQLNHYFTKSYEEYTIKHSRGRADCGLGYGKLEDFDFERASQGIEDTGLRDLWRLMKLQPLPKPRDRSQFQTLANVRKMLKPFLGKDLPDENFQNQLTRFLTCFKAIQRCSLNRDEKSILLNSILDLAVKSLKSNALITDISLMMVTLPYIISSNLPAARDFLHMFKSYLPALILECQTEVEYASEFHARHLLSLLDSI